jgi:hypothetical protein
MANGSYLAWHQLWRNGSNVWLCICEKSLANGGVKAILSMAYQYHIQLAGVINDLA